MAIKIEQVERAGARVVVAFAGVSGSGKTYTALQFACGLAGGDPAKVGMLDTENRRGRLYADVLPGPFAYGELEPPFSPDRYIAAIDEFAKTGIEVLVVDSVTHEYEGTGGILEIQSKYPRGPKGWAIVKEKHKRFVNRLLQAPFHVVVCVRAREKTDFSDPSAPRSRGVEPIQEKNFLFEMTASLLLSDEGTRQQPIKVPAALREHLGRGEGYITQDDGAAVAKWIASGAPVDQAVETWVARLKMSTSHGEDALRQAWEETPADIREKLGGRCPDEIKAAAQAYDAAELEAQSGGEASATTRQILGDEG